MRIERFWIGRLVVALLLTPTVRVLPAQTTPRGGGTACREFVQQFYDWYIKLDARNDRTHEARTTMDIALRERPEAFGSDLMRRLKEDSAAQAKAHEIVGLDFDPFFNSQDPSSIFKVQGVRVEDGRCRAVVYGLEKGTKREEVEPELARAGDRWVFINFHYGTRYSKDDDLMDILKALRSDRKSGK